MKLLSTLATRSVVAALCGLYGLLGAAPEAFAGPGQDALAEFQGDYKAENVVQNRFFLKAKRFEVAPVLGYVPNNPMVKRYVGGLLLGYHFSETLAAGAQLLYSPDLGVDDLKGLAKTLVNIAQSGDSDVKFQQPIDKMTLGATFSANWAPVYGKINLVGETVLNFDLYLSGGLGMLTLSKDYAIYSETVGLEDPVVLQGTPESKVVVPANLAIGLDVFLTQTLALKIDARSYLYIDDKPQYDPEVDVEEKRLYNTFIASVGISVFLPKMKPRMTQF